MEKPEFFLGMVVVDAAGKSVGFKEWGEERLAAWQLETKGFNSYTEKFLMWHLFGTVCSPLYPSFYRAESPVGKIAEETMRRSVFLTIWRCILNADLTKTHSSSVTF